MAIAYTRTRADLNAPVASPGEAVNDPGGIDAVDAIRAAIR